MGRSATPSPATAACVSMASNSKRGPRAISADRMPSAANQSAHAVGRLIRWRSVAAGRSADVRSRCAARYAGLHIGNNSTSINL